MGYVKNIDRLNDGVELMIRRVGSMYVGYFREVVWAVFVEILKQTPQYTGRAVANWRIGVGQPDDDYEPDLGDKVKFNWWDKGEDFAHEKGDTKWILYAMHSNEFKLPLIQRSSKVYITNSVRGDDDKGRSSELYLESLQDAGYWQVKLRDANKPYETADLTIHRMAQEIGRSHGYEFGAGGASLGKYQ